MRKARGLGDRQQSPSPAVGRSAGAQKPEGRLPACVRLGEDSHVRLGEDLVPGEGDDLFREIRIPDGAFRGQEVFPLNGKAPYVRLEAVLLNRSQLPAEGRNVADGGIDDLERLVGAGLGGDVDALEALRDSIEGGGIDPQLVPVDLGELAGDRLD